MTQLRSFPLPIPPLSEQIVILQTLNDLLSLCEQGQQQRVKAANTAQLLASTAVSSITGIQTKEVSTVKVPKTELVSNLNIGTTPADLAQTVLAEILARNNGELSSKMLWNLSNLEIDAFYQQLKVEMANGWIVQPEVAYVKEEEAT